MSPLVESAASARVERLDGVEGRVGIWLVRCEDGSWGLVRWSRLVGDMA